MRAKKRIRAIVDLINDENCIVADIGADHGFLSKILIDENRAKQVYATDISADSLSKTQKLINNYGLSEKIITLVGDGLSPVDGVEIDVAVIAGMGGFEIIKILSNANVGNVKKFIFQPVQNTVELRKYLNQNGFYIVSDFMVKDQGKFYNIIVSEVNGMKQVLTDKEMEFGLTNFDHYNNDFIDYIEKNINKYQTIYLATKNTDVYNKLNMFLNVDNDIKLKFRREICRK